MAPVTRKGPSLILLTLLTLTVGLEHSPPAPTVSGLANGSAMMAGIVLRARTVRLSREFMVAVVKLSEKSS